jgi:hypothetical protein
MATLTPLLFELGQVLATPGALAALEASGEDPHFYLGRHVTGDWGKLSPVDTAANMLALATGSQIVSSFRTSRGAKFLIATAADRSQTYLFLPEDYPSEGAP